MSNNMKTQKKAVTILNSLRAIEILIVFICYILEIAEYTAFQVFYENQGFPSSAYYNSGIYRSTKDSSTFYYNGTKVFSYIVLILTILDSGFYISRYCRNRFYTGPYKRDISINAFFMTLWLLSGIANLYPTFQGHGYTCETSVVGSDDAKIFNAIARECNTKVMVISLGWINGFLFSITTFLAYKLWKERKETRYEGERRVEALGEVVYKYKPRPNTIVQVDKPEQMMIFNKKSEKTRGTPTYVIRTSLTPI